ncbi:AP2/ERF domain [Macleaya cordata]|uniref:AP2/ERF domain n=1 Tax=Macleaya cordata TaxID=56857 RepID=A0A200Q4P4_MACCD|nr:AP2/ERF domain [Macleaya cordata]
MSMEEEMLSMISNEGGLNAVAEHSDSYSSSNPCLQNNKRQKQENNTTSLSPRFKGVVLQQNGHWGAQIYANHQRIWLGTFKSEKEAAMAYDSAAIKLRSGDSDHRNYPWSNLTIQEPYFQNLHTTEAVLNMIKDGSYQSKFLDFVKARSLKMDKEARELNNLLNRGSCVNDRRGFSCQQLFQKELTPSDVGKLNRLVIPKKYAVKYFPQVSEVSNWEEEDKDGGGVDDVQVVIFDKQMKSWKFRYCYWKSSQSFVFTRGWSRFVKEKELKAKDVITFYRCEYREWFKEQQQEAAFCMVDIGYNGDESSNGGGFVGGFADGFTGKRRLELQLGYGQNSTRCGTSSGRDRKRWEDEETEYKVNMGLAPPQPVLADDKKKGFRLFGVNVIVD